MSSISFDADSSSAGVGKGKQGNSPDGTQEESLHAVSSSFQPSQAGSAVTQGQKLTVTIDRIASGGHGLAEVDGLPIFILGAIPGQKVEVIITKRKPRFAEAKLKKVVSKALGEIQPRCKHFWDCGGCVWQHLPYDKQIDYKEQLVKDTLEHVTPVDEAERKNLPGRVLSIIPSPQVFYYRNKLDLSFGFADQQSQTTEGTRKRIHFDENPSIGFHQPGQYSTILPIEECHLYDEQISALLLQVKRFIQETNVSIYNPKTHKGILRSLLLRRGINTGEQMICFLVQAKKRQLEPLFQYFTRFGQHPSVTSLLVVEHFGLSDKPDHPQIHVLKGEAFIRERLFDLTFELSPFSFFQTNTHAAEKLYQSIAQVADLSGRDTVLDCYCGIGSIGQYLSRFAEKVVGVESSSSAINDALKSASKNKIGNISFYKGLAEQVLTRQLAPGGKYAFDCIVLDPPRAGLHAHVIRSVLDHTPKKIVYVSCNTATFARDLGDFLKGGYELRMVQPIDLFPHTAHVETVALLQHA
jgi:23S rRNA (uracil1939-C5)-methyltransferase